MQCLSLLLTLLTLAPACAAPARRKHMQNVSMHDALDKPEKVDGRASNVSTAGSAQLPIMLPATGPRRRAAVVLAMDMWLPEGQDARATRVASFNRWTVDASSVYVCTSKNEQPLIPLLERVVAYDAADPPIDEAADTAPLRSKYHAHTLYLPHTQTVNERKRAIRK